MTSTKKILTSPLFLGWLEDEPQEIPDPDADKPSDWDEEMDGEWEAGLVENPKCASAPGCGKWHTPMIDNPLHKGKWHAPLINNPNYKGKWKPRKIPNPDYFFDPEPFRMTPIGGIGIELWSMSNDIYFDNMVRCQCNKTCLECFESTQMWFNDWSHSGGASTTCSSFVLPRVLQY